MAQRINTNLDAATSARLLAGVSESYARSVDRLSSGLRINSAADDAAGLEMSEALRSQIGGAAVASRNAQDGISMLQTADGGLNETHAVLQRMRVLAVQAANGTLGASDQAAIGDELGTLADEVDRIAISTVFNGHQLLNGSLATSLNGAASSVQPGDSLSSSQVAVEAIDVHNATGGHEFTIDGDAIAGTLTLTDATNGESQSCSVAALTGALTDTQTLDFDKLGVSISLSNGNPSATAANIVSDLDGSTLVTSANDLDLQIGANAGDMLGFSLPSMRANDVGEGHGFVSLAAAVSAFATAPTANAAESLIDNVDRAIGEVSETRATVGALQNALQHTMSGLGVTEQNTSAAESRIRDTDVAAEMVSFTRESVLQQAAQAILAQANQAPKAILQLLSA
jgi:flagellin